MKPWLALFYGLCYSASNQLAQGVKPVCITLLKIDLGGAEECCRLAKLNCPMIRAQTRSLGAWSHTTQLPHISKKKIVMVIGLLDI